MEPIDTAHRSEKYGADIVDGRRVPQLVIEGDHELVGRHAGSVHVERGTLTLRGTLQGRLILHSGTAAVISGAQQGSVTVASGAVGTVLGSIEGSVAVQPGGVVIVEPHGRLAGSLVNDGEVIVRGVFGGPRSGVGTFLLEGAGSVKEPVIVNGNWVYRW